MVVLARLIMIAVIAFGFALIFKKETRDGLLAYAKTNKGIKVIGSARIVMGAVLLMASAQSRLPGLVTVFGIILIIAGIVALVIKKEAINSMAGWWESKPESSQKLMGLIPIIFAAIILLGL